MVAFIISRRVSCSAHKPRNEDSAKTKVETNATILALSIPFSFSSDNRKSMNPLMDSFVIVDSMKWNIYFAQHPPAFC